MRDLLISIDPSVGVASSLQAALASVSLHRGTTMKNIAIVCWMAVLVTLAGCGPSGDGDTTADSGQAATEPDERAASSRQMEGKLPRGMQLNFPYHLLHDGRLHLDSGESQRLVRVEYLDIDRDRVIDAIDENFTNSAYESADERELDSGAVRLRYEHVRADLAAIVTVTTGGDLEHARANGLVVMTFPPKSVADPEDGI